MKKHLLILLQARWLTVLVVLSVIMLLALMIGISQTDALYHTLLALDNWVKSRRILFILWHILIISAIYYAWGVKVDRAAKRANLSVEETIRLKRFRYLMMCFVPLMGLFAGLYGV